MSRPELGEAIRDQFYLEDGVAFCNHGSYGAVPKVVMKERFRLLEEAEKHPDRWFRSTARKEYDDSVEQLAEFVGADPKNLVFITNATTAVNTVVKNLHLEPEDIILLNSHTYGACANAIDSAVQRAGADTINMDLMFPIRSEEHLLEQILEPCRRHVAIRLAIIDHISSPSAIVFPVKKLAKELRKLGVLLLVDGAHAPGQIPLNLEDLDADFYTGNLHKWCYSPKGAAFLWVAPRHKSKIQPLVTSHLYKKDITDQFFMQGTADHTPFLCVRDGLKFYKGLGGRDAILEHVTPLLDWAQQMLCHAFNTPVIPVPPSMQAPFMRLLRLPDTDKYPINQEALEHSKTELALLPAFGDVMSFCGHIWLRISGNVYNCKEDYLRLRDELTKRF